MDALLQHLVHPYSFYITRFSLRFSVDDFKQTATHRGVLSREYNSEKIDGTFVYIWFLSNFGKISMTIDVTIAEKMKAGPFSLIFIII